MAKPQWNSILCYYILACTISWPFFWWKDVHAQSWAHAAVPEWIRWMCIMWGPGIAALVCLALFRNAHQRTITFWGNSKILSICFYVIPMLLLAMVHPPADRLLFGAVQDPESKRLTPILFVWVAMLSFCWALGEEFGWRGFLQDALRPVPFVRRYVFLGILWGFWHFTNMTTNRSLKGIIVTLAIFYPAIILITFIIGMAVERSHSLWVAVTIHSWIDLSIRLRTERTFIVFAVSILFWGFLLWRWPQLRES